MKEKLLEIMEDFNLDDAIFLKSEIEKGEFEDAASSADQLMSVCARILDTLEEYWEEMEES